jgi:hypothetical protein
MPGDFFVAEPLRSYAMRQRCKKLVRLSDLFDSRSSFEASLFLSPLHGAAEVRRRCSDVFLETSETHLLHRSFTLHERRRLSSAELKLLRQLYAQFVAVLRRIELLERERLVRLNFEQFLRRLPLPTIILRWDLKPVYQNPAARVFCAVWEKGPEEAKRTKANSPVPGEIVDQCRVLKQRWMNAQS